jgi:hypothetical protein
MRPACVCRKHHKSRPSKTHKPVKQSGNNRHRDSMQCRKRHLFSARPKNEYSVCIFRPSHWSLTKPGHSASVASESDRYCPHYVTPLPFKTRIDNSINRTYTRINRTYISINRTYNSINRTYNSINRTIIAFIERIIALIGRIIVLIEL